MPRDPGEPDRDLYSGLIRLHILHHAAEEPIFGLGMAEELARHGYAPGLCIRWYAVSRRRDTSAHGRNAMANQGGSCFELRRLGAGLWKRRNRKFASYLAN